MNGSKKIYNLWARWGSGWIPFWIVSAVIVRGAVMPSDDVPKFLFFLNDKVIHAGEFWVCTLAAYNAFRMAMTGWIQENRFFCAFIYSFGLGIFTEIIQYLTPARQPEFLDFVFDFLGVLTAMAVLFFFRKTKKGEPA